ncbi:MAG: phosphodiester glycosidase family protein [Candidatus Limivicinus sp.]|nr:phosphodiester glycosidase family protein [Candidatus Limivicinus sp.]
MKRKERYTDYADAPSKDMENMAGRKKEERQKKAISVINKILGFFMTTAILIGVAGLSLEYVLVKGPSPSLKDTFVMTMLETRRFGFIAHIFLSDEEVAEIKSRNTSTEVVEQDTSLINIPTQNTEGEEGEESVTVETIDYGLVDEDGDGIIIDQVVKKLCTGYMMIVQDPSRVFVGKPDNFGGSGLSVEAMCKKYNAIGGINGGGYFDDGGGGSGGIPTGLTVSEGVFYNENLETGIFIGFDQAGILHVGNIDTATAHDVGIRDGVTFSLGPILVANGLPVDAVGITTGMNPRTAIGQRADGAVLMLVIDGRQAQSAGATYADLTEIMLDYGAINACNLDGGSSTAMWFDGEYVNNCSTNPRNLPTCFLVRREG